MQSANGEKCQDAKQYDTQEQKQKKKLRIKAIKINGIKTKQHYGAVICNPPIDPWERCVMYRHIGDTQYRQWKQKVSYKIDPYIRHGQSMYQE